MPDRSLAQPTPTVRLRPVLRGLARRWRLGVAAVVGLAFAAPLGLLAYGTARARACLASYAEPRGPELPDCRREIRWFVTPSRIPWTAVAARYRAEELSLRAAVAAYDDAAVGRPDGARELRAGEELALAEQVVRKGSTRITLEDLGPAVGAPDPGRSALLAGDRRTLVARADQWEHWSVRLRALEAALLEGGAPRAGAMARRYAEFDPRDEDLRVAVAAALCLDGEPGRGGDLLTAVQAERAHDRHEAWSRNWGDVRALIVACAAKAGKPPPLPPERAEAGRDGGDPGAQAEASAVLRLRRVALTDPGDTFPVRAAAVDVIAMLKSGPFTPGGRVRVLAALLASGHGVDPNLAAVLATPRRADGEPPLLAPSRGRTAIDWLDVPRGVLPSASPPRQALRHAVDQLQRLAASSEVSAEERATLETAASATALEAARAFALAGEGADAVAMIDRAGARALPGESAPALARSTAWYVAGDPARALAEVEREPADLAGDGALQVAWWTQKAELLASAGRRDEAARAAVLADDAATSLEDRSPAARAAWTRLALAPRSALRSEPPPPLPGARAWPWVSGAGEATSPLVLGRALGFWDAARRASPEEKRALRYAVFADHRGDSPRAGSAYLALAAELLPAGEGDVEVWLDAFDATAARGRTLRAQAWTRAEAARFRGDAASASRWDERYRTLARLAATPDDAELCAALGI